MAHALSRSRLGSRQGARHALQHRRRHPHGARHRRHAAAATGRAATPSAGTATRRNSATSRSATISRSTPIRSASWSTPTASASSTRAPISATTPMRNTAASSSMQPGQFAWQIFDKKVLHLLRDEYRIKQRDQGRGRHAGGAGRQARGRRCRAGARRRSRPTTPRSRQDVPFNPNVKDGRGTAGWRLPKSNWANTLDEPPFEAFAVTCGVTFTFGGLQIDTDGAVLDTDAHADSRPLCGRRAGRRAVLLQLSRRHRTDGRRGVRQNCGHDGRTPRSAMPR